ncbi:hypothetical protein PENTCL1PPCAC_19684, partial [Pristionchus entomophagus]
IDIAQSIPNESQSTGDRHLTDDNLLKEQSMDVNVSGDSDPIDRFSTIATFTKSRVEPKKEKVEPKEEPIDIAKSIPNENQFTGDQQLTADSLLNEQSMNENVSGDSDPIDRLSTIATFTKPQMRPKEEKVEPKEEPFDIIEAVACDNEIPHSDFMEDGIDEMLGNDRQNSLDESIEREGEDEETINDATDAPEDSSENVEVERRKRPTRSAPNLVKYTESL